MELGASAWADQLNLSHEGLELQRGEALDSLPPNARIAVEYPKKMLSFTASRHSDESAGVMEYGGSTSEASVIVSGLPRATDPHARRSAVLEAMAVFGEVVDVSFSDADTPFPCVQAVVELRTIDAAKAAVTAGTVSLLGVTATITPSLFVESAMCSKNRASDVLGAVLASLYLGGRKGVHAVKQVPSHVRKWDTEHRVSVRSEEAARKVGKFVDHTAAKAMRKPVIAKTVRTVQGWGHSVRDFFKSTVEAAQDRIRAASTTPEQHGEGDRAAGGSGRGSGEGPSPPSVPSGRALPPVPPPRIPDSIPMAATATPTVATAASSSSSSSSMPASTSTSSPYVVADEPDVPAIVEWPTPSRPTTYSGPSPSTPSTSIADLPPEEEPIHV